MRKVWMMFLLLWGGLAQADEVVIAALGDSLTQGYGLVQEEGFVPQLQAWLNDHGADVRLINAGVSGDTSAGGLARVDWTLEPDVDGMIVTLGGNDLLRGLDPLQVRNNIEGILQAAQSANVDVLLIGMQAPGNFGSEYKDQFDGLYPDLAQEYDSGYLESFFVGLSDGGTSADLAEFSKWFQRDGIHPNAAGVERIVQGIGPKVLALIDLIEADD
jgi:acyl-CoA thioesterase-1